ncbi:hypothetical protein Bhyg_03147 [Pseudolycoriella hygida]|uniref:Uncharacterized protein n=1 Tax=Pseudolycoriella hygida TaxID=35572 RepID=A0A9Q0ND46_9DIPT|nr:hypothetical protein Bhyg_03147 [Pseudolycoriella hygida]
MEARNRDRIRDPREQILLETNFDDDGILTRAYNNNKAHCMEIIISQQIGETENLQPVLDSKKRLD